MTDPDPFRHHPELKPLVKPVETSRFRTQQPRDLAPIFAARGITDIEVYRDDVRNAMRRQTLAGREGDLWVFGYGSLLWDPAIRFSEVRRAYLPDYARKFCLETFLGRGSPEAPGLMAALDLGAGCEGLIYRIPAAQVDEESDVLWRREIIFPGYLPLFHQVSCAGGPVEALCFVLDRTVPHARLDLDRDETARRIARAAGFLGSNMEYLENVVAHMDAFGIEDAEMSDLLARARKYQAGI